MKWISCSLFLALALFLCACEEHSAKETRDSVQEEGAGEVAAASNESSPATPPEASNANPAGANPVEPRPAGESGSPKQDAPKFFDSK